MSQDDTKPLPRPDDNRTAPDPKMPAHPSDIPTAPGLGVEVEPKLSAAEMKRTVPDRRLLVDRGAATTPDRIESRSQERTDPLPREALTSPGKTPVLILERTADPLERRAATTVRDLPVKMVTDASEAATEPLPPGSRLPSPPIDRGAVTTPDRPTLKTQDEDKPRNPLASTDEIAIDELLSGMGAGDDSKKAKPKPAIEMRTEGAKAEFHAAAAPPAPHVEKPSDGSVLVAQTDPPPPKPAPAITEPMAAEAKPQERTTVPPLLPRAELGEMRKPQPTMHVKEKTPRPWWALAVMFVIVLLLGGIIIWLWDQQSRPPPVVDTNPTTAPTATPRVGDPQGPVPMQPTIAPVVADPPAPTARASAQATVPRGTAAPPKNAPTAKAPADTDLFQKKPE